MKTRALERTQEKLKSAHDDIDDLQAEFEEERQSMLDTIRGQERQLQLHKQILDKMVPLIHRDCNYYNIDKIKVDAHFDEDSHEWILPKVVRASTSLVVPSKGSQNLSDHSPSHGKMRKSMEDRSSSPTPSSKRSDDHLTKILSKPDNTDYFKPKRAQELLAECSAIKGVSPERSRKNLHGTTSLGSINKSPIHNSSGGATSGGMVAGSGIFSVESQLLPLSDSKGKPRKLNSIPLLQGIHVCIIILLKLSNCITYMYAVAHKALNCGHFNQ